MGRGWAFLYIRSTRRLRDRNRGIAAAHMIRRSAFDTRPHPTNIHPQIMEHFFHCKDWADDSCFHLISFLPLFSPFLMPRRESSFLAVH